MANVQMEFSPSMLATTTEQKWQWTDLEIRPAWTIHRAKELRRFVVTAMKLSISNASASSCSGTSVASHCSILRSLRLPHLHELLDIVPPFSSTTATQPTLIQPALDRSILSRYVHVVWDRLGHEDFRHEPSEIMSEQRISNSSHCHCLCSPMLVARDEMNHQAPSTSFQAELLTRDVRGPISSASVAAASSVVATTYSSHDASVSG
ncbi:hypothetical protein B0J13DRAFT_206164 [Dactylonectria estremocensis]|uniref:Uncharacterized protein n=1 Tax=Dactylonectria estremocensis TaxID=1079267 RepID=A0A9P9DAK3_9HYPO|nr:hypothetical protein B0J13DRAFT_206164 [Dactylonectria estremocensis]